MPEFPPLGHQDADWSPDGKTLLYVKNGRDGAARRAPDLSGYDSKTKSSRPHRPRLQRRRATRPDGRYIVATKTSTLGTDVVILDARNGNELAPHHRATATPGARCGRRRRLASPILHIDGGVTDLDSVIARAGTAGHWTVGDRTP